MAQPYQRILSTKINKPQFRNSMLNYGRGRCHERSGAKGGDGASGVADHLAYYPGRLLIYPLKSGCMSQAEWTKSAFLLMFTRSPASISPCVSPGPKGLRNLLTGKGGRHAVSSQDDLKRIRPMICLQRDGRTFPATIHAQIAWPLLSSSTSLS